MSVLQRFFAIACFCVIVHSRPETRVNWVNICEESSGNKCCAPDNEGMGNSTSRHDYWIMKTADSWINLDLLCKTEDGARLAVFESQRENDCVAKYLIKEFEDSTAKQYAIGLRTDSEYPGIFQWNHIKSSEPNANTEGTLTLSFNNWDGTATTTGDCVVMTAGASDAKNGRWSVVDCNSASTFYGICEHSPELE